MEDKEKVYKPFDFIKSVSKNKINLMPDNDEPTESERIEKMYVPYVINKGLGMFSDTIFHANIMNMYHEEMPSKSQYQYYLHVIRPRDRFKKWNKFTYGKDIEMIMKYYKCTRIVATQYSKILTQDNLKVINNNMAQGGHNGK